MVLVSSAPFKTTPENRGGLTLDRDTASSALAFGESEARHENCVDFDNAPGPYLDVCDFRPRIPDPALASPCAVQKYPARLDA
jgi:hypothetical protein